VRLEERIITVNIPLCLRCISRSRSARKDPRRVPLTFALRPWQSRETLRIDPISSLADRKSRKRSTSRAASRPATRRFVSFQSSLATTSLLVAFVLRAGKGELTLICKRSLFSLKRALLYFYTSILRLSLSLFMYVYYKRTIQHEQSTCGVQKKKHTHKFFYFFLELANDEPTNDQDQGNHHFETTTTSRREGKGRPRIEDNFFFPHSLLFFLKRSALARGNLEITTRRRYVRAIYIHTHTHTYIHINCFSRYIHAPK